MFLLNGAQNNYPSFCIDFMGLLLIMKGLNDKGRSHYLRDVIFS